MLDGHPITSATRFFLTGQLLSALGNALSQFAVPIAVYKTTGQTQDLAISYALAFLPNLLIGTFSGVIADRYNRRTLLLTADLCRAATLVSVCIWSVANGSVILAQLYATVFVNGALTSISGAAQFAVLPGLANGRPLVKINAQLQAALSTASILGPAFAGALALAFQPGILIGIDGASFALSALCTWLAMRGRIWQVTDPRARSTISRGIKEGFSFLFAQPVLRTLLALTILLNLFAGATVSLIVVLATESFGATTSQVALMYAASGIGILGISLVVSRLNPRPSARLFAVSLLAEGALTMILSTVSTLWVALPIYAVISGMGVVFNISTAALRQRLTPDRLRGRVLGSTALFAYAAVPVGTVTGPLLVGGGEVSVRTVYLVIGVAGSVIALVFFPRLRRAFILSEVALT